MTERPLLLTLHRIGAAYGRLPHEILELAPWQLALAERCVDVAREAGAELAEGAKAFGVLDLGRMV